MPGALDLFPHRGDYIYESTWGDNPDRSLSRPTR